jgi:hypothetical protein
VCLRSLVSRAKGGRALRSLFSVRVGRRNRLHTPRLDVVGETVDLDLPAVERVGAEQQVARQLVLAHHLADQGRAAPLTGSPNWQATEVASTAIREAALDLRISTMRADIRRLVRYGV